MKVLAVTVSVAILGACGGSDGGANPVPPPPPPPDPELQWDNGNWDEKEWA